MAASDKYHYLPKSSEVSKPFADPSERLTLYKKHLKNGLYALVEQFKKGTSINQLLKARSAFADNILWQSWQQFSVDNDCCLVAVGGYGRSELHPYSDIDILILLNKENGDTSNLESWISFLWDIGLEIGHSVRTVNTCETLALDDITIATNLMESRLIGGNRKLFSQLEALVADKKYWPIEKFFQAKVEEQRKRHANFKDTSFNLEPNIKSNPGGLRDLQVMQWISLKHFKSASLHGLIEKEVFTRREYKALLAHQKFLNRVRFALHAIARKREDRLLFEHQKKVAEWLGYEDAEHKLAVEQLMQPYYQAVMAIRNLNGLFIQIFEQENLNQSSSSERQELGECFYIQDKSIGLKEEFEFKDIPWALIKIFHHISIDQNIKQIDAYTLRKIRSSQPLINKAFRNDPQVLTCLQQLFASKQFTSRGFALMKRTNVLGAVLPLFAKIEGQMQFDLFHAYTVDEHTLFLLRYIVRYNRIDCQDEFPICSEIMAKLDDHSVIHLAAIFHDIAKGRGGDHSELGAIDALDYCRSIGLSSDDSELVAWLVKNHLIMSLVAQRKDISDPEVISEFCKRVASMKHLELLYVLTVSDIRATNPTLWNSWKESLLKELFLASKFYLSKQTANAEKTEKLQDHRQLILGSVNSEYKTAFKKWLNELGDDYLFRYHPEQISWHLSLLANEPSLPQVHIKNYRSQAGTEILIAVNDQVNLFAAITSALSQNNLNIQSATLFTSEKGLCLDTFIVLDQDGKPITQTGRVDETQKKLLGSVADIQNANLKVSRLAPSRYKHFEVKTELNFSRKDANSFTQLEVLALDRPALLAKIAIAFRDAQIKVHAAKIVTLGEKVEDTFIISNKDLSALNSQQQEHLEQLIITYLES